MDLAVFLDRFSIDSLAVQCQYRTAYALLDNSGAIAREMLAIWPSLEFVEGLQNQIVLRAKGIQIQTGANASLAVLSGDAAKDRLVNERVNEVFKVWRNGLLLERLQRVSTRGIYVAEYETIGAANAALADLNLVKQPSLKMFDQKEHSVQNALEVAYKFEDDSSFSFLRIRTEGLRIAMIAEPPFGQDPIQKELNRLVVDFDRGLLGSVDANKFQMDEWLKGFHHILKRDIEKLVGASS